MRVRERLKARERRAAVAGTEKSEEKVLNSMFQPCEDMPKSVEGKQEKESPAQAKDDNGEIIVKKDTEDCEESHVEEGASGGKEEKRNDATLKTAVFSILIATGRESSSSAWRT